MNGCTAPTTPTGCSAAHPASRNRPAVILGIAARIGAAVFCIALAFAAPAQAEPSERLVVQGQARAVDGDTIDVEGTRIRLHGIDAPETRQNCTAADGSAWACGRYAAAVLAAAVADADVACTARGRDRYQRMVATCWVGAVEVGHAMVAQGMALADQRFGRAYGAVEETARTAALGLWAGSFEAPWEWRRARRRS